MKVGIVIPAYNEEKRIGNTLDAYSLYFENLRKDGDIDYEILVSINNTKDQTEEIVSYFTKRNHRIKCINLVRGGKGYAVMEGFKILLKDDFDCIGFIDADLATSPDSFYDLINNIKDYDCIIASRYIDGAVVSPKQSLRRILASRVYNVFIRALFLMPYRDTQCGAKIFKNQPLKEIMPKIGITKWAFDVDLLYNIRKSGFRIKEFPTTWSDKSYSKINFIQSGPMMTLALIRLRLLNSPARNFIRVYDFLIDILTRWKAKIK